MSSLNEVLETTYYLVKYPCGYVSKGAGGTPYLYTTEGRAGAAIKKLVKSDHYITPAKQAKYKVIPVSIKAM